MDSKFKIWIINKNLAIEGKVIAYYLLTFPYKKYSFCIKNIFPRYEDFYLARPKRSHTLFDACDFAGDATVHDLKNAGEAAISLWMQRYDMTRNDGERSPGQ